MTRPAPETLEREKDKLFVSDAELIRRLGLPEKTARSRLRELDKKDPSFPKKQKLWGDRRYWPHVEAYFDRQCGPRLAAPAQRTANDR